MDIAAIDEKQQINVKQRGGFRLGAGRKPSKEPKAPKNDPFILPKIPFRRGSNRFEDFTIWWHALNEEQLDKLIIYGYRQWPVCDAKISNPDASDYIEKLTGPCPFTIDNWRLDVLGRYGSGSYCFFVKEGNVQRWTIYAQDIVDLNNYPPLIDYKTLLVSAPANKDFVKWARQRNLIQDYEEGENGMANAAIDRLVDQSDRLVNRVIDMADRSSQPVDVDTSAQLAGMEMIQKAGERALDVAMKSADRLAELSSRSQDPLELVKAFTSMAGTLNGANKGNDGQITALMQQMLDSERKRNDTMQEEIREMRRDMERKRNSNEEGGIAGDGGFLGQLKGLGEIKNVLSELGIIKLPNPDGSSDEQSESTGKSGSLKTALLEQAFKQLPQMIGPGGINGLIGNIVAGIQAARGLQQVQQAIPANGQAQQPIQNGQPQIHHNPVQSVPTHQPPTLSNGFPPPPVTGMPDIDGPLLYVWKVAPTLLHHMNSADLSGYTFARWLIDSDATGRQQYDIMKEAGAVNVKALLEAYPALWDVLSKTPVKLDKFLTEMLRLDEWEVEQEAVGDEGEEEDETEEMPIAAIAGKGK